MNIQEMYNNRHNYKTYGGDKIFDIFNEFFDYDRSFEWDKFEEAEKRFVTYSVNTWFCTDTRVGLLMYTLDGEYVGMSWQPGRRCDTCYMFDSTNVDKLKDFALSLAEPEEYSFQTTNMDDSVSVAWLEKEEE